MMQVCTTVGRPHRVDSVGQDLQAVADQEEHISHTAAVLHPANRDILPPHD